MVTPTPRKVVIPAFQLTQVCDADAPGAKQREIEFGNETYSYFVRPADAPNLSKPRAWNLFAFPLDQHGRPWHLATNYLLDRIQNDYRPSMTTYQALADDLGAYREWLDRSDNSELMFLFPQMKLERVTYRYHGHLRNLIFAGEIAAETASHRMLTVVDFYRFLVESEFFVPDFAPWQEKRINLLFKSDYGSVISKSVTTTDLKVKTPRAGDAFHDTILDGGQLRPLPQQEQLWLMEALLELGNSEMHLLCLFMIATGARIQTACTLRAGHFLDERQVFKSQISGGQEVVKLKCGPGTLIDTKNNKLGVLQIPLPLFRMLRTYAHSDRARFRRERAKGGDRPEQYLFLSNRFNPYYLDKDESTAYDPNRTSRTVNAGGTVRKFVTERLVPYIRARHDAKFEFKIHDLRATFGMNQTDIQLTLVDKGQITLTKARDVVRQLMWHDRAATTDRYLDYRAKMAMVYAAINGYGEQVQRWIDDAMTMVVTDV
jgi:hypothetical protein